MSQTKIKKGLLVTLDPGKRSSGVAIFHHKRLVYAHNPRHNNGGGAVQLYEMGQKIIESAKEGRPGRHAARDTVFAYEKMYMRKDKLEAVKDLIDLSIVTGVALGGINAEERREVSPAEWTDGRDKEANHPLIRKRLDEEELAYLDSVLKKTAASGRKEVMDAVGIGLYLLWRL